ncbi:hypothetical protein SERLADRAFT_356525 [Serpula lacrymans var. lacrymans S7.9]|uniref:Endonuclease/exonuclease/phosphatase domain-containing protein n=1 Tax=Serpula lacrymans var. lacrymans (strain S7.9) TaxID=578457 RepID=F8NYJ9_SERL9|nr:uncharacterized protein SERLADRAFT_356525 [Serpula lacrymans var. lacrymans S7.9]EGO23670.1 hypothetical protein SERLADRAFT_356525 [Serpula lacrymans var. lacrymans S7.9]
MLLSLALVVILTSPALSTTIAEIQGHAFQSLYAGEKVTHLTGTVVAISKSGFYLAGHPVKDERVSTGLFVRSSASVSLGDSLSLSGTVSEYRSSRNDLSSTELISPSSILVTSSANTIAPILLGQDRSPPQGQLSALDVVAGPDAWLSVPNNVSQVDAGNESLKPQTYGLDFWESIEGMLVTVPSPVAIGFNDNYGEFWVHGAWNVTGKNSRGGLTMVLDLDGLPDANPEMVIIGRPLDDTTNPTVAMGTTLTDITGVVHFQYGYFYILPLTAPSVISSPTSAAPPTTISSSFDSCIITIGDYNVENMAPTSSHMSAVASHIVSHLLSPDLLFLQEIQDDSGSTNNGIVSANTTLSNIVNAIMDMGGVAYAWVDVDPLNNMDGGEKGGNIRQAYLYNPDKLDLVPGSPTGNATEATAVVSDGSGGYTLSYNPGRIDPTNAAWKDSRKPLAAAWQTRNGDRLFSVNLQLTAKLDSSTTEGNTRPPINAWVAERMEQVAVVATFSQSLLASSPDASLIVGGDCNEYIYTTSVFAPLTALLSEVDSIATPPVPPEERYTYVYNGVTEQLDHMFVSAAVAGRGVSVQHIHVNNWAMNIAERASDHDPSVLEVKVC